MDVAGLDFNVRVHDLRHAHASWLLAGGADNHQCVAIWELADLFWPQNRDVVAVASALASAVAAERRAATGGVPRAAGVAAIAI